MKQLSLVIAFFLVSFSISLNAQKNPEGTWHGKLDISTTSLRMVFHIKQENGTYTATMDSPDQGAKGIPFQKVLVSGDSIRMVMQAANAELIGVFTTDTSFSGYWLQGVKLPIELKKQGKGNVTAALKRPQTPKPPYPYKSEDVIYFNNNKSMQFGATITTPQGTGPFPAVLLLTGSGQQNRDEEIYEHKPFAVIADYLTRKGFIVMRVDDRGVGQTTGDLTNATTKDFADDATISFDYLRKMPKTDPKRMGLIGHSEGGMIAQIMASENKEIDFVVFLASPGEKIINLMAGQNRAVLAKQGLSATTVNRYADLYRSMALPIATAPTDSSARVVAKTILDNWIKNTPKEIADTTIGGTSEPAKNAFANEFVRSFRNPWIKYFIQFDPDIYVKKIRAKVLALNGDQDIQVLAAPNLAALRSSLKKSKSKTYELIVLKGLNHLFQRCIRCTVAEYADLEETIAPEVLETIGQWLVQNVINKK